MSEANLLNNDNIRKTGQSYWLISPGNLYNGYSSIVRGISATGYAWNQHVYMKYGLRPVISLAPGIEYSEGNGSMEKPYIIDVGE